MFNKDKTYVKWRICTLFTYMISVVQSKRERIDDENDQVAMGFSISFDWLRQDKHKRSAEKITSMPRS